MKFLVVGGGSMGKRRVRCLLANGVDAEQIRMVDPREDRRQESRDKYGVGGFSDLDTGLDWGPDAVLVSLQREIAHKVCTAALKAGKHVFCEVPMSMSAQQSEEFARLAAEKGVIAAPGTQVDFHPLTIQCRDWVRDESFGKPLLFNQEWCQYMPGWHPYEPLSAYYSPGQLLGVITLEIGQLYFLTADRFDSLKCTRDHVSSLETYGGDTYHIAGLTQRGMSVCFHFDVIQRPARNLTRITSEQGTIELDLRANTARRYLVATEQWETVGVPEGYEYEQCYIDEIDSFLKAIRGEAAWHNPIAQATDVAAVLDAMESEANQPSTKVQSPVAV